jgi:hypothetical protein
MSLLVKKTNKIKTMTAVEYIIEQLPLIQQEGLRDVIEQAKEMEKQQIIDAWNGGDYAYFCSKETGRDFADGTEYYNETCGSKKIKFTEEEWVELNNGSKESGVLTSSQTEISDEEIEKQAYEFKLDYENVGVTEFEVSAFIMGMKKYKEQLKIIL